MPYVPVPRVHTGLDSRLICGLRTIPPTTRVPDDLPVRLRDEDPMPSACVFCIPVLPPLKARGFEIEGDMRGADVVVVDFIDCQHVQIGCRSNVHGFILAIRTGSLVSVVLTLVRRRVTLEKPRRVHLERLAGGTGRSEPAKGPFDGLVEATQWILVMVGGVALRSIEVHARLLGAGT
jgi:hypothetical protein